MSLNQALRFFYACHILKPLGWWVHWNAVLAAYFCQFGIATQLQFTARRIAEHGHRILDQLIAELQ